MLWLFNTTSCFFPSRKGSQRPTDGNFWTFYSAATRLFEPSNFVLSSWHETRFVFAPHPFLGKTLSVGHRLAEKMPAPHYDNPKCHLAPMKIDFLLLPYCLFMALISVIIYEVSRNWFNCLGDHLQEVSFVRYMSTGQAQWAPDGEFKQRWVHLSVHPGDSMK